MAHPAILNIGLAGATADWLMVGLSKKYTGFSNHSLYFLLGYGIRAKVHNYSKDRPLS